MTSKRTTTARTTSAKTTTVITSTSQKTTPSPPNTTQKPIINESIEDSSEESNEIDNEVLVSNNQGDDIIKPALSTEAPHKESESEEFEYYEDDEEEQVDCTGKDYVQSTVCSQYYQCDHGKPILFHCKEGTIYQVEKQICDWPANADRKECRTPSL